MKSNRSLLIWPAIWLLCASAPTLACSIAASTHPFIPTGEASPTPQAPKCTVHEIQRGSNDLSQGSCADIGQLTLTLLDPINPNIGYRFEIDQGSFKGQLFPNTPVQANDLSERGNRYKFAWLDGRQKIQEPIDIRVKITAINHAGEISEPFFLTIQDSGKPRPWWKFW